MPKPRVTLTVRIDGQDGDTGSSISPSPRGSSSSLVSSALQQGFTAAGTAIDKFRRLSPNAMTTALESTTQGLSRSISNMSLRSSSSNGMTDIAKQSPRWHEGDVGPHGVADPDMVESLPPYEDDGEAEQGSGKGETESGSASDTDWENLGSKNQERLPTDEEEYANALLGTSLENLTTTPYSMDSHGHASEGAESSRGKRQQRPPHVRVSGEERVPPSKSLKGSHE